jgi:hypothetical protein
MSKIFSHRDVLLRPVISEKSYGLQDEFNKYTFVVAPHATKTQIRRNLGGDFQMMKACALLVALPLAAISVPAAATDIAGSWNVTYTNVRPTSLDGTQSCFTLTETGDVMGWSDSGTFTMGSVTGEYYSIQGVLTAFATLSNGYLVLTGKFHTGTIINTSVLEVLNGQPAITGQFTATSTASC